jgi:dipeptidase E
MYPFPNGPEGAYRFISGTAASPMCGLGWKSMGVLELTALPSVKRENWVPVVQETDALLVWGGDVVYLSRWMRESGLADLLPSLHEMVYVGTSAGAMVTAPTFVETTGEPDSPFVTGTGLGLVDFTLLPHVGHESFPENSLANAEIWAAQLPVPGYAIDDQTAIKAVDGTIEVISEGTWKLFAPGRDAS